MDVGTVGEEIKAVEMEKIVVESDKVEPELADNNIIDESGYEIISNNDVPPADSDEVIMAVEKMVPLSLPAAGNNDPSGTSGLAAENELCDSSVLFSREFVGNQALVNKEHDPTGSFSVVSYNILADYYAQKDFGGDKAPWVTDEQLAISSRHVRLMKELEFLDSDIVCFQEVQGNHMNDLLTPDMEALVFSLCIVVDSVTINCF
jgi:hypothetical protein